LRDAEPALLLSVGEVAERLPESPTRRLLLDRPEVARRLEQSSTIDPTDQERIRPLRSSHPAYVIYTSGSPARLKEWSSPIVESCGSSAIQNMSGSMPGR